MANVSHKLTTVEDVSIKGTLGANGDTVIYTEKDEVREVSVSEYLKLFIGSNISISIKRKTEDNLGDTY